MGNWYEAVTLIGVRVLKSEIKTGGTYIEGFEKTNNECSNVYLDEEKRFRVIKQYTWVYNEEELYVCIYVGKHDHRDNVSPAFVKFDDNLLEKKEELREYLEEAGLWEDNEDIFEERFGVYTYQRCG